MKKSRKIKTYLTVLSILVFSVGTITTTAYAALTASTSLTIVHVTNYRNNMVDPNWPTWPTSPDAVYPFTASSLPPNTYPQTHHGKYPNYANLGVYLYDFHGNYDGLGWKSAPSKTPYYAYPNGINSMIASVWSEDEGKTWTLTSWDYLTPYTHYHHTGGYPKDCWNGSMIHPMCDDKGCNGQIRSNLVFYETLEFYADPNGCWGVKVME